MTDLTPILRRLFMLCQQNITYKSTTTCMGYCNGNRYYSNLYMQQKWLEACYHNV